jgi:hypothetical protein
MFSKVHPFLDIIRVNSQASRQPHQELAVGEAMVLFKGRSTLKQNMPMKPTKQGFKSWCACDPHNGYMYNLDVYQGAGEGSDEDGLGAAVVLKLLRQLFNSHHHAYTDNFFSSFIQPCQVKGQRDQYDRDRQNQQKALA